jgi:hypothetical protein
MFILRLARMSRLLWLFVAVVFLSTILLSTLRSENLFGTWFRLAKGCLSVTIRLVDSFAYTTEI